MPGEGFYEEILNTDAETYGGSNAGNYGGMHAEPVSWQGQSHSIVLRLPPLATIGFKKHSYHQPEPAPQSAIENASHSTPETTAQGAPH